MARDCGPKVLEDIRVARIGNLYGTLPILVGGGVSGTRKKKTASANITASPRRNAIACRSEIQAG
jgi:hypothetical protein